MLQTSAMTEANEAQALLESTSLPNSQLKHNNQKSEKVQTHVTNNIVAQKTPKSTSKSVRRQVREREVNESREVESSSSECSLPRPRSKPRSMSRDRVPMASGPPSTRTRLGSGVGQGRQPSSAGQSRTGSSAGQPRTSSMQGKSRTNSTSGPPSKPSRTPSVNSPPIGLGSDAPKAVQKEGYFKNLGTESISSSVARRPSMGPSPGPGPGPSQQPLKMKSEGSVQSVDSLSGSSGYSQKIAFSETNMQSSLGYLP